MKHNHDDRTDNAERIEYNIGKTLENIRRAEDMIEITDDEKTKETLIAKNERREEALSGMRKEIKDEATQRRED